MIRDYKWQQIQILYVTHNFWYIILNCSKLYIKKTSVYSIFLNVSFEVK